jgi:hypothetical protein
MRGSALFAAYYHLLRILPFQNQATQIGNPWRCLECDAWGFDYILAPPSRVLVSQHRLSASGLIP